jgi:hydroxylamine reductase (hybrid-cluster protein)
MGLVVVGVLSDEKMGLSVTSCPVSVICHYLEDKALYNMYNL